MYFSNTLILKDFDTFLDYFQDDESAVDLTSTSENIKGTDLVILNDKMLSFKSRFVNNKSKQESFNLLNVFFHIALTSRLLIKGSDSKGNKTLLLPNTSRVALYDSLSEDEKMFFLLDTFWSYLDWRYCFDVGYFNAQLLDTLRKKPIGQRLTIARRGRREQADIDAWIGTFVYDFFAAFGLWDMEWDPAITQKVDKYTCPYVALTLTQMGKDILPALKPKALLSNVFLFDEDEEEDVPQLAEDFKKYFKGWNITNKLLPLPAEALKTGIYQFKISWGKKDYRVIELAGSHTFHDLHLMIQEALDFNNDHLYAFYMDNKPDSRNEQMTLIGQPYYDDEDDFYHDGGLPAHETKIGEFPLNEGQKFIYLFDFGACWEFKGLLQHITLQEAEPAEARIVASVGKAPEQYGEW